jgi:UDP-N-acetylmuramoyl-tripeptide--D-alanyl-D-alanine ligase
VRFSTAELAVGLGGQLIGPDVTIEGAGIDSRSIERGQLFVPIVADRDGHDFIPDALDAGAAAYLTSQLVVGGSAVLVPDTQAALTQLGVMARAGLAGDAIGITGSVGKTTTKDLLGACLASAFRTASSARSLNNELGVPLTLVNAAEDTEWIVLEMGARGPGHIRDLVEMSRPQVGVVTSVAMAHLEFFGDLEGVFRAKSELVVGLPESGVAVLNFDDPNVRRMAEFSPGAVVSYGIDTGADVVAARVVLTDELQPSFTLTSEWGSAEVALRLHGFHQVSNALAAAAASLWCGVPLDGVVAALADAAGPSLRMDVRRPSRGPTLIVDCYNANPTSTEAALRSLAALRAARRVALLGVMAELGADSAEQHRRIAALAEELGIEVVGYQTNLYGPSQVATVKAAVDRATDLSSGDALLIKGSRVARLEDVVDAYGLAIDDQSFVSPWPKPR